MGNSQDLVSQASFDAEKDTTNRLFETNKQDFIDRLNSISSKPQSSNASRQESLQSPEMIDLLHDEDFDEIISCWDVSPKRSKFSSVDWANTNSKKNLFGLSARVVNPKRSKRDNLRSPPAKPLRRISPERSLIPIQSEKPAVIEAVTNNNEKEECSNSTELTIATTEQCFVRHPRKRRIAAKSTKSTSRTQATTRPSTKDSPAVTTRSRQPQLDREAGKTRSKVKRQQIASDVRCGRCDGCQKDPCRKCKECKNGNTDICFLRLCSKLSDRLKRGLKSQVTEFIRGLPLDDELRRQLDDLYHITPFSWKHHQNTHCGECIGCLGSDCGRCSQCKIGNGRCAFRPCREIDKIPNLTGNQKKTIRENTMLAAFRAIEKMDYCDDDWKVDYLRNKKKLKSIQKALKQRFDDLFLSDIEMGFSTAFKRGNPEPGEYIGKMVYALWKAKGEQPGSIEEVRLPGFLNVFLE